MKLLTKIQAILFFLLLAACGPDTQDAEPVDPEKQAYNQRLLESAQAKEAELRKKAKQADAEGVSTPIGKSPKASQQGAAASGQQSPQRTAIAQPLTLPPVQRPITPVCKRTPIVRDALLKKLEKTDCRNVTMEDLQSIVILVMGAIPDMHPNASRGTYFPVRQLKSGDFSGLTSLELLNLRLNRLDTLPEGVFDWLTSLKKLHIEDNYLYNVPENIFSRLVNLEYLEIERSLRDCPLPSTIFDNLHSLQYLDFDSIGCESIPAGIFKNLANLKTLNFSARPDGSVPDGIFNNLAGLKTLHFSVEIKTPLSPNIFNGLTSLEKLGLYANNRDSDEKTTPLPTEIFSSLPSIKHIALKTRPESLHPRLFYGVRSTLEELDLASNKLKSLPPEIFQGLTSLVKLSLGINRLESLPENLFNGLSSLKGLGLSFNPLKSVPKSLFKDLPALEDLSLSWTHVQGLPSMKGHSSLKQFDIASTWINAQEYNRIQKEAQSLPTKPIIGK